MIGTELGLVTVMYVSQKGFTGWFAAFHIALFFLSLSVIVMVLGSLIFPDDGSDHERLEYEE